MQNCNINYYNITYSAMLSYQRMKDINLRIKEKTFRNQHLATPDSPEEISRRKIRVLRSIKGVVPHPAIGVQTSDYNKAGEWSKRDQEMVFVHYPPKESSQDIQYFEKHTIIPMGEQQQLKRVECIIAKSNQLLKTMSSNSDTKKGFQKYPNMEVQKTTSPFGSFGKKIEASSPNVFATNDKRNNKNSQSSIFQHAPQQLFQKRKENDLVSTPKGLFSNIKFEASSQPKNISIFQNYSLHNNQINPPNFTNQIGKNQHKMLLTQNSEKNDTKQKQTLNNNLNQAYTQVPKNVINHPEKKEFVRPPVFEFSGTYDTIQPQPASDNLNKQCQQLYSPVAPQLNLFGGPASTNIGMMFQKNPLNNLKNKSLFDVPKEVNPFNPVINKPATLFGNLTQNSLFSSPSFQFPEKQLPGFFPFNPQQKVKFQKNMKNDQSKLSATIQTNQETSPQQRSIFSGASNSLFSFNKIDTIPTQRSKQSLNSSPKGLFKVETKNSSIFDFTNKSIFSQPFDTSTNEKIGNGLFLPSQNQSTGTIFSENTSKPADDGNEQDEDDDGPIQADEPQITEGNMLYDYKSEMDILAKYNADIFKKDEDQSINNVIVSLQKPSSGNKLYLYVRSKQTKNVIYTGIILPSTICTLMKSNKANARLSPVVHVSTVQGSAEQKVMMNIIRIKFGQVPSAQNFETSLRSNKQ